MAIALLAAALVGCAPWRVDPPDGSTGARPENHEALVRDYVRDSTLLRGFDITSVSQPVPGWVLLETKVSPNDRSGFPAAISVGWLVAAAGNDTCGLLKGPRTHIFLLRHCKVRAVVMNGHEEWGRGRRYALTLTALKERRWVDPNARERPDTEEDKRCRE